MRKSYLIGLTTALLGLAAIVGGTAPALAAGGTGPDFWWQGTFTQTPCGGDFGLLGNAEAPQVTQSNPMNGPVCD